MRRGQTGAEGPRTPWGDPDLQGVWDYWTFTPLERPAEFGERGELTAEEAAVVAQQGNAEALARDSDGPPPGEVGGYSQEVWTDRARATALTQASLLVDPPDGRLPALTAEAEAAAEAHRAAGGYPVRVRVGGLNEDRPEARGVAERCLLGFSTGPPMLPGGYNNNVQIFQSPGYVVLLHEMVHDVRVVPVDGRDALPSGVRQWLGSSRGRWEGDTLVVETTNFTDGTGSFNTSFVSWGSAENTRLVERVHAGGRRHHPLRVHRGRSRHVDGAVHRHVPAEPVRRAPLRVRLPRGQPRHVQPAERRAGGGAGGGGRAAVGGE